MIDCWALVNRRNREVDTITPDRLESLMNPQVKRYLRTSCVFMRNAEGKFWTPRRVSNVKIAPNGLDFAVAKHGKPEEPPMNTALRGFKEELGRYPSPTEFTLVGQLGPMLQLRLPYFSTIYICENDITPDYSREHFTGGEWLAPQEILRRIEASEPAKSLLVPSIKLLMLQEGTL